MELTEAQRKHLNVLKRKAEIIRAAAARRQATEYAQADAPTEKRSGELVALWTRIDGVERKVGL